jgi:hypothetical protein
LSVELFRRQLFEEAGIEAGGVVDEYIDAAESIDRGPHCRVGIRAARDVQLHRQQIVRLSQGLGHTVNVPAGGDNRVAGVQGRPGEIRAHTRASASDEPNLLVAHDISPPFPLELGAAKIVC